MVQDVFAPLLAELERWSKAEKRLCLWWRDDDAADVSPQLGRLIAIAKRYRVPLALAVIPAGATLALAERLREEPDILCLQHGFRHRNEALPGERAVECGGERDTHAIVGDLLEGRTRLENLFGNGFLPVMVPPWNRIEQRVARALALHGYRGLSAFGLPDAALGNLPQLHADLDILRWKGGARFAGTEKLIKALLEEMEARRLGSARPLGILTHHLDHDPEAWAFLDALLAILAAHPAIRFVHGAELFSAEAVA